MTPIETAKFIDLKAYAELHLGLEVPVGTSRQTLTQQIKEIEPDITEIPEAGDSPDTGPEDVKVSGAGSVKIGGNSGAPETHYSNDPVVMIRVASTREPGGNRAVFVGVNGDGFLIQRDRDVNVPYRVYEALEHALEERYEFIDGGPGERPSLEPREAHSYAFNIRRMPSDEEVEAWRARVADTFAP